ncbi:putative 2-aminoethylphosphonate transport system permease protein PhnV [Caloramator mitchellensis]|uniref:Putative 2-aminoethylphosphonate transport system permease protein PhnV n=1 Tax=Caloramator mitchellensis TaxID=908809 RepID=A0A0R3K510_CALMK|nr:ABC transporter permease subunit [Caloramator mitchellensis]KRQ87455.1 putative 2-aminoethylphosphonate transport system permease protein PhnV [Caloramator mitchellensis]
MILKKIIVFILLFPLLIIFLWSFASTWSWPNLFPEGISTRGFVSIISKGNGSLEALINSIAISFCVTIIALIISIMAARALGLYEFKGKWIIKLAMFAPIIVPITPVGMGIHYIFIKLGIANTLLGIIIAHLIPTLPYGIRIITDIIEIVGDKFENQGKVLGASKVKVFINITLPMIMPGIITAGSLIFIVSFSQYFLTFIIGGGVISTFPIIMFPFIQNGDRVIASSYSIVFVVTAIIILLILENAVKKYFKLQNHFYL